MKVNKYTTLGGIIIAGIILLAEVNALSDKEYDHFTKIMKKYAPNESTIILEWDKTFSYNPNELSSLFFKAPISLLIKENYFYVLDNMLSRLVVFDKSGNLKHEIGQGQGPGEIQYPVSIRDYEESIAILNRNGIDIFNKNAEFLRRINVFVGSHDFVFADSSLVISLAAQPMRDKLAILQLYGTDGKIIREIYDDEPTNLSKYQAAYVTYNDNRIFYFDRLKNRIIILNPAGDIVGRTKIKYGLIDEVVNWNTEDKISAGGRMTNFIPSIRSLKVYHGSIYILLNIPRLEIIRVDYDGKVEEQFMNQNDFNLMQWTDFSIAEEVNRIVFYVLGFKRHDDAGSQQEEEIYRLTADKHD